MASNLETKTKRRIVMKFLHMIESVGSQQKPPPKFLGCPQKIWGYPQF